MYQLQIRHLAKEDIQLIVDYYDEKVSTSVSDKFLENLYFEFSFLTKNPEKFQVKYRNTRVRYLKNFPFGIHYQIKKNSFIEILAIIHTSRNPNSWKHKH